MAQYIGEKLEELKSVAWQLAQISGDTGVLATQEIKAGYVRGHITKKEKNLLCRAVADAANSRGGQYMGNVANVLDAYEGVFRKADYLPPRYMDGRVNAEERNTAQKNYRTWLDLVSSPFSDPKAIAEAEAKTVKWTRVPDGKQIPVPAPAALLKKLDALLAC